MQNLKDIRREYTMASLDIANVDPNPLKQFEKWFDEALKADVLEVNAFNLATLNEHGRPTSRIVLLKGIEAEEFYFYTNYQSKKGRELEQNGACAMTFFWPELERQIRIEGFAQRAESEKSDLYFASRPRGSQIGAWSSPQSTPILNREILEQRAKNITEKFKDEDKIPRPKQWGGFKVQPILFEFWQGRANRLHDRIEYNLTETKWKIYRLAP